MTSSRNTRTKGKSLTSRTGANLLLDLALTLIFLALLKPVLTGLPLHEWVGIGIGIPLAIHLVWHWKWVVGITKKLLRRLPSRTRAYYVLDFLLLASLLAAIGSGIAISVIVLPTFGIVIYPSLIVVVMHKWVSYLALALLGCKLVLHWRWLMEAVRRIVSAGRRAKAEQCEKGMGGSTLVPERLVVENDELE